MATVYLRGLVHVAFHIHCTCIIKTIIRPTELLLTGRMMKAMGEVDATLIPYQSVD